MWFGWGFCEVTYKLRAPEGKTFRDLHLIMTAPFLLRKMPVKAQLRLSLLFIGDSDTEMGVAKSAYVLYQ